MPPGASASSASMAGLSTRSASAEHLPAPAVTDPLTLTGSLGLGGFDGFFQKLTSARNLRMPFYLEIGPLQMGLKTSRRNHPGSAQWSAPLGEETMRRHRRRWRCEGGGRRGSNVSASQGTPGTASSAYVAATGSQERGTGRCLPQRPQEKPTLWIPRFLTSGLLVCVRIPFCCLW